MAARPVESESLEAWRRSYEAVDNNGLVGDESTARLSDLLSDTDSDDVDLARFEDQVTQSMLRKTVDSRALCNDCRREFGRWPGFGRTHAASAVWRSSCMAELVAGMSLGCDFCSLLFTHLREKGLLGTYLKVENRISGANSSVVVAESRWSLHGEQVLWLNVPGKTATVADSLWAKKMALRATEVSPLLYSAHTEEPLELAARWLQDCIEHHGCAAATFTEGPTRLVELSESTARLVKTGELAGLPSYATLSYCWGSEPFLKLTASNASTLNRGLSLDLLPTTFRDAIHVALALGLRYIWIDALCIIQSSPEAPDCSDWLAESGRMRAIYGGSHLNIAAASAPNAHRSIFSRAEGFCAGVIARTTSGDSVNPVRAIFPRNAYALSTIGSHLATRSWTLQERLLAPRTLYIGDRGLFWECEEFCASQCLPHGLATGLRLVRAKDAACDWEQIVRSYSRAHMSDPADKLPALAGVARRQSEITGDAYLAGLWESDLLRQLCWMCRDKCPRLPQWRAPSWSWTFVDGQAEMTTTLGFKKDGLVEILHASTLPAGPDPFGAVRDAHLRIACSGMLHGAFYPTGDGQEYVIVTTPLQVLHAFRVHLDCTPQSDAVVEADALYLLPLSENILTETTVPFEEEMARDAIEYGLKLDPLPPFPEELGGIDGTVLARQGP